MRSGTIASGAALLVLAVALVGAIKVAAVEYQVVDMRATSIRQAADLGDVDAAMRSTLPSDRIAARSALLRGVMRTRAAAQDPAKSATLLVDAAHDIDRALDARPVWGEAAVAATYLSFIRHGPASIATRDALRQSYAAAPFLRDSAPWRIRYAVSVWPLLDGDVRSHVIAETAWLARASGRTYAYARGLVAGSPAAAGVDAALNDNAD